MTLNAEWWISSDSVLSGEKKQWLLGEVHLCMHTDHDHLQEKQTYLDSQACSLCVVLFWYCRPWLLILLLQAFTCGFLLFGFWMFKSYNCFSSVQHFFFFLLLGYLTCLLLVVTDGASSSSLIPNHLSFSSPSSSERANTRTISQQLLILSELEFRKTFLILSYIGRSVLQVYSGFFLRPQRADI